MEAQCSEVALAWAIRQGVDVALFGARSPDHVELRLRAATLASEPELGDVCVRLPRRVAAR